MAARKMTAKQVAKATEDRIRSVYNRVCNGVPVPIMELGKINSAAKKAIESGATDDRLAYVIREHAESVRYQGREKPAVNGEGMTYLEWMRAAQTHNEDAWRAGEDPSDHRKATEDREFKAYSDAKELLRTAEVRAGRK